MQRILFICYGNICRSTMAESVFTELVRRAGRAGEFVIDSAATSTEEIGNPPHHGTVAKLREVGIPAQILGVLFQNPVRSSLHPVGQCIQGVIDDLLLAESKRSFCLPHLFKNIFYLFHSHFILSKSLPHRISPNTNNHSVP